MEIAQLNQIGRSACAGLVAALAGAVGWGLITSATHYEIGFLAWGIGCLVGVAVARAGTAASEVRMAIAIAAALLGILVGKYLAFVLTVRDIAPAGVTVPMLSEFTIDLFVRNRDVVFGPYDLLWGGLAALSAARIGGSCREGRVDSLDTGRGGDEGVAHDGVGQANDAGWRDRRPTSVGTFHADERT